MKTEGKCKTCGDKFLFDAWHTKGFYCSRACSGRRPKTKKWQDAMSKLKGEANPFYGRKHTKETIERIASSKSKNLDTPRGDKSPLWRGGVTEINKKIRSSAGYKEWRRSVFFRDDYTCVLCHERGVELHADHIKPFSLHPELRFSIENGRTLCVPCHKDTPTYLGKIKTYAKK